MIPFNIELYKQGRPVVTRNGLPVRIICTDREGNYPIIGLIKYPDGREYVRTALNNGKQSSIGSHHLDFFHPAEKYDFWLVVFIGSRGLPSCWTRTTEEGMQRAQARLARKGIPSVVHKITLPVGENAEPTALEL